MPSFIDSKDEALEFHAEFPAAQPDDPVITALRKDAQSYMERKRREADEALAEARKAKSHRPFPWTIDIEWSFTGRAGDMVSLSGASSEFEGGAHPIERFDTFIGRTDGTPIKFEDMLVLTHSPSPAMTVAICEAIKAAKQERIGSATIFDEPIVCTGPKANAHVDQGKIALADSNISGRFGGVIVHFEPYILGASVEGDYRVIVQQKNFAEDLKPEFKPLFGGEAPPLKN